MLAYSFFFKKKNSLHDLLSPWLVQLALLCLTPWGDSTGMWAGVRMWRLTAEARASLWLPNQVTVLGGASFFPESSAAEREQK